MNIVEIISFGTNLQINNGITYYLVDKIMEDGFSISANLVISNKINTKRRINPRGFLNRLFTIAQYRLKLLMTSIIF